MKLFSKTKRQLFDLLRESKNLTRTQQKSRLIQHLIAQLHEVCPEDLYDRGASIVRSNASRFCSKFYQRWDKCERKVDDFLSQNDEWLNGEVMFELPDGAKKKSQGKIGRPSKSFQASATRSKRRKIEPLQRQKHSSAELLFAAATQYRSEGDEQVAKLLFMILDNSQTASDILDTCKKSETLILPEKLSPGEGVSLIIEADLSKAQYILIRSVAKSHHADVFPSYDVILEAKQKAYPSQDSIKVTGTCAEVKLQNLLDLNASRIIEALDNKEVLNDLTQTDLELSHKWGCDGSGGHPQYKQKTPDESNADTSILLTAIVPLQLKVCDAPESPVLWTNPSPSSTRYCQPLRVQFVKETEDTLKAEEAYFADQIESLQPSTVVTENGKLLRIHHRLSMTMIDGKARNMLTDTSSMATCCACGATPTAMSVRSVVNRPVNTSVFKYGISVLHARIRFLECVLHVSYKLEIKKWSANKLTYKERKTRIQNGLRTELGLLVDVVKQGSGSTNDGNTARKFFDNPATVSTITGFDQDLIERFATILTTLASGCEIDVNKFRLYSMETAQRFENMYPWYYMPASVHFILIHGAEVMASLELPMGVYSEEALESRNKNIRSFREHRTRKCSREATMTDLFNRLLLTGDVLFSSYRSAKLKPNREFPENVQNLLK